MNAQVMGAGPDGRPSARLGFVGLGNMGAPMVRRLIAAGHAPVVQDISPSALQVFADGGAHAVKTPVEVSDQVGIVFCSLPTPDVVQDVCTGPTGLVNGKAVRIIVDLSTTGPRVTARLASFFEEKGVAFVDAPVSGGVTGAEQGTLSVMAAGDRQAFDAVEPLLRAFGRNVFYVGARPGMGQTMKLVNNMLAATNAVAAFETLVMGAKAGLDPQVMLDVINVSSGRNSATLDKVPQCVLPRTFPMRFATSLLYKDVRLCVEEAEAAGALLWLGQTVKQILAFAVAQGDGDKDYANVIRHFERWADATVGVESKSNGE
jgi:3-hydroxyisobutyrate dehydrogenase